MTMCNGIYYHNQKIITQRGCGDFKIGWKFLRGKMELGETPEAGQG